MRKVLGLLLLIVVVTLVSAYASFQSRYILQQEQRAEYVGLQQSIRGVAALNAEGQNGLTIALSDKFFSAFAAAIAGKTLQATVSSLPGENLALTIAGVNFRPQAGTMKTQFDLQLSSDKRNYSIGLRVGAVAYFAGIERVAATASEPEKFSADFKFLPVEVEPRLRFGPLNIVARRFVGEIINGNLIQTFLEKMKVPLVYDPHLKYVIDENGDYQQHFGNVTQNIIRYRISHKTVTIEKWVRINEPILTKQGIMLTAGLSVEKPQPTVLEATASDTPTEARMTQFRSQITESEEKISHLYSSDAIAVSIGAGAISEIAGTASSVIRKLSITLQSTSISGRFIDKRWSDKILGDGGFYAEAAGGDRLHGSISSTGFGLNYKPGSGLNGSFALALSADADLHIHIDPLIGGGVGTTIKLVGSARPSVSASVQTGNFQFEGRQVTFAAPVINCTAIELKIQTDGKLAFAGGWVNVPAIGIRSGQLVGKEPLNPIILSGTPVSIPLIAKSSKVDGTNEGGPRLTVTEGLFLTTTITSLDIQPGTDGYRLSASPAISISNDLPDGAESAKHLARLNKAVQDYWRKNYNPSCPAPPDLRVLVGDIEFGPNNEILKFIRNAWNDITKGPGKNNEVVKLLNRINAAASTYDAETKKLANQIGVDAQKAFGGDAGVGHAAGELAKSVTKAVTNPVRAVGDFGKQLSKGFR